MPSKSRTLWCFLWAVVLAAALGSLLQTQCNLAMLQQLGAPIPWSVRLHTSLLDLFGFAPLFAVLVALGFAAALPAAFGLSRCWPRIRGLCFALAGALALWASMALANALLPMPTLIAANRSLSGTLGLMACGSVGALLFALLSRRAKQGRVCTGLMDD